MTRHILVAVDGSEHADRAVEFTVELAGCVGAPVTVLHVVPTTSPAPTIVGTYAELEQIWRNARGALEEAGRELVDRVAGRLRRAGVEDVRTRVEVGPPARTIVDVAREVDADVIVLGRRGLGDLEGLLLGSVSHKVAQIAEATVVTVR